MSKGLYYPISIIQGETLDLPFDIIEGNEFLDLSLLTFVGQVRGSIPTPLATFTFVEDDEDINVLHAVISAADTNITPSGLYVYEIRYTDADQKVSTLLHGSFDVRQTFISAPTATGQFVNSSTPPPEMNGMFRPLT